MRTWQGAPAIWGPRAAAPPANTTGPALRACHGGVTPGSGEPDATTILPCTHRVARCGDSTRALLHAS